MIVYTGLLKIMKERNLTWQQLAEYADIAENTSLQFPKGKMVSLTVIDKVCTYLKVQPGDVLEWVPGNEALELEAEIKRLQKKLNEMKNIKE